MRFVRQIKFVSTLVAALVAGAGLWLLIQPQTAAVTACRVLGVLAAALGAARLCGYFSGDPYRLAFQFDLAAGLFLLLTGGALVLRAEKIYEALPVVMGLFIMIDSLLKLQTALDARRFGVPRWWCILALGLCAAALGTALLLRPFAGAQSMTRLLGLCLLASSVQDVYIIQSTVRVIRAAGQPKGEGPRCGRG